MLTFIACFGAGQGCGLFDSSSGSWIDVPEQTVDFDLNIGLAQISSLQAPAQQTVTIELPATQFDLSSEQTLKDYAKPNAVKIRYLNYSITTNTSNIDLPAFDIFMDSYDATVIGDSSIEVAQLPVIQASQVGSGEVIFVEGGKEAMSNFLLGLMFTVLGRAEVTIDAVTPTGQLTGQLLIGVSLRVKPL